MLEIRLAVKRPGSDIECKTTKLLQNGCVIKVIMICQAVKSPAV
jgi:hypothetical protein